jgi:hypothetical protein
MPITPKEAFIAGHNLAYSVAYFDQVLMTARLSSDENKERQEHGRNMVERIQQIAPNFAGRIKVISEIAADHSIEVGTLPSTPQEYRHWAPLIFQKFTETWTLEDTEGWCFLMGHAIGELRSGLIISSMGLDFQIHLKMDFSKSISGFMAAFPEMLGRWEDAVLKNLTTPWGDAFMKRYTDLSPAFDAIHQTQQVSDPRKELLLLQLMRSIVAQLAKIEQDEMNYLPSASD